MKDATSVAEKISKEYSERTLAIICDITKPKDVEKAINEAAEKIGTIVNIPQGQASYNASKAGALILQNHWQLSG